MRKIAIRGNLNSTEFVLDEIKELRHYGQSATYDHRCGFGLAAVCVRDTTSLGERALIRIPPETYLDNYEVGVGGTKVYHTVIKT